MKARVIVLLGYKQLSHFHHETAVLLNVSCYVMIQQEKAIILCPLMFDCFFQIPLLKNGAVQLTAFKGNFGY